jgi:hypothetical protein
LQRNLNQGDTMPGGGGAYGKRPEDMGIIELLTEAALRTAVTGIAVLIVVCLVLGRDLDAGVRVGAGIVGVPIIVALGVSVAGCVQQLCRRVRT